MKLPFHLQMFLLGLKPFGRPWYQHFELENGLSNYKYVGDRGRLRTKLMLEALDVFPFCEDDIVTDIGSNASVFGQYILGRVAKIYGIELDRKFHRQAKFLKSFHQNPDLKKKLILLNKDINSCGKEISESNIIFMSKVLYHKNLKENQLKLLDMILHKNLRGIIMQGHTTQGSYGEMKFIEGFMDDNNFEVIYTNDHYEYPIVCGIRKAD